MPNFYEETKGLLEKIEENTRDGGGETPTGGSGSSNGLTNAELRAAAVDVVGPATNAQIRASAIAVSGPATDAQIRANPINVNLSGITTTNLAASFQIITTTGNGTIPQGAQSVAFFNEGPNVVSVAGGDLPVGRGVSFDAGINRLGQINYNLNSTSSLHIAEVR